MAQSTWIKEFLDDTALLDPSPEGQALIDQIKVLDALGVSKKKIRRIIVRRIKSFSIYSSRLH